MENNDKEFNDAIDREDSINPDSGNEEGKDFLEDDLSVHLEDHTLVLTSFLSSWDAFVCLFAYFQPCISP